MRTIEILNDLNKVLIPALGCTDPVSIAYTSSLARSINPGEIIKSIQIILNYALFKNAVSVYIPNTEMYGIEYAFTLGAIFNAPELKMDLLRNLKNNNIYVVTKLLLCNKKDIPCHNSRSLLMLTKTGYFFLEKKKFFFPRY